MTATGLGSPCGRLDWGVYAVNCPNPLTPEQCTVLTQLLQWIAENRELIMKTQRCGVELPDKLANNQAQCDFASAIKREFFPDQP